MMTHKRLPIHPCDKRYSEVLYRWLAEEQILKSITIRDIYQVMGVSRPTLYQYLAMQIEPSQKRLLSLADMSGWAGRLGRELLGWDITT